MSVTVIHNVHLFPAYGKIGEFVREYLEKIGSLKEVPARYEAGRRYRTRTYDPYHVKVVL